MVSRKPKATDRRFMYVRSLAELTPDQAFIIKSTELVRRQTREGAAPGMFRIEFYSKRKAARIFQLRKLLIDAGVWPSEPDQTPDQTQSNDFD